MPALPAPIPPPRGSPAPARRQALSALAHDDLVAEAVRRLPLPALPRPRGDLPLTTAMWLRTYRAVRTRRALFVDLEHFLLWLQARGRWPLEVGQADITAYLAAIQTPSPGHRSATCNRRLATLRSWYNYLGRAMLMTRNPASRIPRPPATAIRAARLSAADVKALLSAADATTRRYRPGSARWLTAMRNHALVAVLADAGLRVAELVDLDVADARPESDTWTLSVTGRRGRHLTLRPATGRILAAWLSAHPDPGHGPLFPTSRGTRLTQPTVFRLVRGLARTAGPAFAEKVSPRELRRAVAVTALDERRPIAQVRKLLGHGDERTTIRLVQDGD